MVDKKLTTNDGDNEMAKVDTSVMEVDNEGQRDAINNGSSEENSEKVTNELTQTDHLNKRLLEAFLTRINTSNEEGTILVDTTQDSSDWVDEST